MRIWFTDLCHYINLLIRTTATYALAATGALDLVLRLLPPKQLPPWAPAAHIWTACVMLGCLLYATFAVFRNQKTAFDELRKSFTEAVDNNAERARMLWHEIGSNLDGFNHPVRYQDEAYKLYETDPISGLSQEARHALTNHYNCARSLRAMASGRPDPRQADHVEWLREGLKESAGKARAALAELFSPWKNLPNRPPKLPGS